MNESSAYVGIWRFRIFALLILLTVPVHKKHINEDTEIATLFKTHSTNRTNNWSINFSDGHGMVARTSVETYRL